MVKFSRFFFLVVLFALFVVASLVNVQSVSAHGGNGVTVLSNGTVIVNGNRNHHSGGSISANGVRIQSGSHGGNNNANRFNQNGGFNGIGRRR